MSSTTDRPTSADPASKPVRPTSRLVWRLLTAVLAVLVIALCFSSFVFVDETEYVIVERLGEITAVYDRPEDRGPHFKLPWPIDVVRRFDRRIQLFEPLGREIFTRDKKNVTVSTYVCWKIADPPAETDAESASRPVVQFFRSLGDLELAQATLDSRLRSILSTRIGQIELNQLLQASHSEAGPNAAEPGRMDELAAELRQALTRQPGEQESLEERLGISIVDVRVRRLNLPTGNQQAVFERMRSERRKIADRYRSSGMAENAVIKSRADRRHAEILANAARESEEIRGQAEAEAIGILNRAHSQDPELHKVLQTLDTYRNILNEKTTLVLSASSNLLKLLTDGVPNLPAEKSSVPDTPSEAPKPPAGDVVPKLSDAQQDKDRPDGGTP